MTTHSLSRFLSALPARRLLTGAGTSPLFPATVAALLGLALLFGVGFAQANLVHEATHDVRHAMGFPCH